MAILTYILGEPGVLGFPIDQPDGTPMPLADLSLRLAIYLAGADLMIPGYASSGEFLFPYGVRNHPSIAAFNVPADLPLVAQPYKCAVQINSGTGWHTLEGHIHTLDARRY